MPERKEGFWPERSEGLKTASAHGRINSLPEWRNRQTRWTQKPKFSPWKFAFPLLTVPGILQHSGAFPLQDVNNPVNLFCTKNGQQDKRGDVGTRLNSCRSATCWSSSRSTARRRRKDNAKVKGGARKRYVSMIQTLKVRPGHSWPGMPPPRSRPSPAYSTSASTTRNCPAGRLPRRAASAGTGQDAKQ